MSPDKEQALLGQRFFCYRAICCVPARISSHLSEASIAGQRGFLAGEPSSSAQPCGLAVKQPLEAATGPRFLFALPTFVL